MEPLTIGATKFCNYIMINIINNNINKNINNKNVIINNNNNITI